MTLFKVYQVISIFEVVLVHQFVESLIEVSPKLSLLDLFPDFRNCISYQRPFELISNVCSKMRNETVKTFFNTIPLQSFNHNGKIIETDFVLFEENFFLLFSLNLAAEEEKEEKSEGQVDADHVVEEMIAFGIN